MNDANIPNEVAWHDFIATQWHPTKNGDRLFSDMTAGMRDQVWWYRQECNHTWPTRFDHRYNGVSKSCPVCKKDMTARFPLLASQWHPTKNGAHKFDQFAANDNTYDAWWLDDRGHEWSAKIRSRTRVNGSGCPDCLRISKIKPGQSFGEQHPTLAQQWDYTANAPYGPNDFSEKSGFRAGWVCEHGHTWPARIINRVQGTSGQGQNCPTCAGNQLDPELALSKTHPHLAAQLVPELNTKTADEISAGSGYEGTWRCDNGHIWTVPVYARTAGNDCGKCSANHSKQEDVIGAWLTDLGINHIQNDRKVLHGAELDFYLPDHNMGIEYNGVHWHSEQYKPRDYHLQKHRAAQNAGIKLIQVWEDDWLYRQEIVKTMLLHRLGMSSQLSIGARKTHVQTLTAATARAFFDTYHLQGFAVGSHYLALADNDNRLVAAIILKKVPAADHEFYITRYATSMRVPGGFTKLLKYAQREFTVARFITFSDNMVSEGDLYAEHGFTQESLLPPDYMYGNHGVREHKFNYRLARFRKDQHLTYEPGLSESQLATLNGLNRVWDAGKIRWTLTQ